MDRTMQRTNEKINKSTFKIINQLIYFVHGAQTNGNSFLVGKAQRC